MSERQQELVASQAALAAWRASGGWRTDPVRFFALEALAGRVEAQPAAVQQLLVRKLQEGVAAFAQRAEATPDAPPPRAEPVGGALLAELNASLRAARPAVPAEPGEDAEELASVRRFRRAWDRSRALDQVDRAAARRPAQAGPLNSHMLVVQALELMRELSPEYLRHFLGVVETLQWLDGATVAAGKASTRNAKSPRRARAAKK